LGGVGSVLPVQSISRIPAWLVNTWCLPRASA
jgi:hypothetical protein